MWEDYYNPYDYIGAADKEALEYLDSHPNADKKAVKHAAENFALAYEYSDSLRQKSFKNQLFIAMKTADYNSKKRRKEVKKMDAELKQAIIRDYQIGMTVREIAERYGLHPHTTLNNITNWAAKGLLELRSSTPKSKDKPKHVKTEEKAPEKSEIAGACKEESPTCEEPPKVEFYENGFPVEYETPEPPEEAERTEEEPEPIEDDGADFLAVLDELKEFASEVFPGSYIVEAYASNVKDAACVQFRDSTDRLYVLKIEEREGA